jgi:hypothetical protein
MGLAQFGGARIVSPVFFILFASDVLLGRGAYFCLFIK